MNSVFYMHSIATIVNCSFMIMVWRYNVKLININYDLMKENTKLYSNAFNDQASIAKYECLLADIRRADLRKNK